MEEEDVDGITVMGEGAEAKPSSEDPQLLLLPLRTVEVSACTLEPVEGIKFLIISRK